MLRILVVDDEAGIRFAIAEALRSEGHEVVAAADGIYGLEQLSARVFDVVVSDVQMPRLDGLALFRRVKAEAPDTEVILMTAHGSVQDAVQALKEGASDYLLKPFEIDEILIRVARSSEKRELRRSLAAARGELARTTGEIIGNSPVMQRLLDRLETVSSSDAPVLVTGETGTGKELVARRIHALSTRSKRPFVAVNCAAFPESLLEAELFGHERGAFTGAMKQRDGRFKSADGGTLFLDEIAEIPPTAQVKLLRALQEGGIEPLGSDTSVTVDVRVISATHQNLKTAIAEKRFREDLYYRLNVLDLQVPPLRERRGDLPALVEHFMHRSLKGAVPASISPAAWAALSEHAFPGNVRELQHAIERAVVMARGAEIDLVHLPEDVRAAPEQPRVSAPPSGAIRPLGVAVREFEREYLLRALDLAGGKKAKAADMLGISRKNVWEKLKAYGVDVT